MTLTRLSPAMLAIWLLVFGGAAGLLWFVPAELEPVIGSVLLAIAAFNVLNRRRLGESLRGSPVWRIVGEGGASTLYLGIGLAVGLVGLLMWLLHLLVARH